MEIALLEYGDNIVGEVVNTPPVVVVPEYPSFSILIILFVTMIFGILATKFRALAKQVLPF